MADLPATLYWSSFQGTFFGLLKWRDMGVLWDQLKASPDGWYVFDCQDEPPGEPISSADLEIFLTETEQFLRKRHRADYCGLIYVDDKDAPEFIKIFDPQNMGTACGCSDKIILPRWTLTRIKPDARAMANPNPSKKSSWLSRGLDRGLNRVFGRNPLAGLDRDRDRRRDGDGAE